MHNSCVPQWNQSNDFPFTDHGEFITLEVFDKTNEHEVDDPDVEIGSAKVTVGKMLLAGGSMEVELKKSNSIGHQQAYLSL